MRPFTLAVVGSLAAALAAAPPAARAQPPRPVPAAGGGAEAEAERIIKRGVELRRRGDDRAALEELRRAYAVSPGPRTAAQVGLAAQALGLWIEAEARLAEALAGQDHPWIRKNRKVLEASLRTVRREIGRLEVAGEPAGAEVWVNGRSVGKLPLAELVRVEPGPVRVELRAPGYATGTMTVTVAGGQESRVDLRLEKERERDKEKAAPAAGPVTSVNLPPPQVVVVQAPAAAQPAASASGTGTDQAASPRFARTARWVALGGAALFLGGGAAGLAIHDGKIGDFTTQMCRVDPRTGGALDKEGARSLPCQSLLDDANTGKRVAWIGFVGGGLLALTSAVLFFAF